MSEKPIPFGFIQDQGHLVPDYGGVNDLFRVQTGPVTSGVPAREVVRRMIYDGEKFVPFDGFEGAAVLNKLLQDRK